MALLSDNVGIETQLRVFLGVNFWTCTKESGPPSIAKGCMLEVVCVYGLLGSRLYSHMWGVESEMGVWLDGEGVG